MLIGPTLRHWPMGGCLCCEEVMGGRGREVDRVLTPTVCPNFPFGMTRPDTADFCIGETENVWE